MKTIGVVMLDERQNVIADRLQKEFAVIPIRSQRALDAVLEMDAIVLPVRGVDEHQQIRMPDKTVLDFSFMSVLKDRISPAFRVFAGIHNEHITAWQLPVVYLMDLESVIEANAQLTAQGILAEILHHCKKRIQDVKIDVIGYGHCGRWIAKYLKALDVPVRVVRRSVSSSGSDQEIMLDRWQRSETVGDIVINTAPALVVTETVIASIRNQPYFIDIASKPGGIDYEACRKHGFEVLTAPPLPSVYTPVTAGEILAQAIKEEMNKFE